MHDKCMCKLVQFQNCYSYMIISNRLCKSPQYQKREKKILNFIMLQDNNLGRELCLFRNPVTPDLLWPFNRFNDNIEWNIVGQVLFSCFFNDLLKTFYFDIFHGWSFIFTTMQCNFYSHKLCLTEDIGETEWSSGCNYKVLWVGIPNAHH